MSEQKQEVIHILTEEQWQVVTKYILTRPAGEVLSVIDNLKAGVHVPMSLADLGEALRARQAQQGASDGSQSNSN